MGARTVGAIRAALPGKPRPEAGLERSWGRAWSAPMIGDMLLLLDAAMLAASGAAAYSVSALLHVGPQGGSQIVAGAAAALTAALLMRILGLQTLARLVAGRPPFLRAFGAVAVGGAIAWCCLRVVGDGPLPALAWSGAWAAAAGAAVVLSRSMLPGQAQDWIRSGRVGYRIAVVGAMPGPDFLAGLENGPEQAVLVGCYAADPAGTQTAGSEQVAFSGGLDTLLLHLRIGRVDAVLVTLPATDRDGIALVRAAVQHSVADIYLLPEARDCAPKGARPAAVGRHPLLLIAQKPLRDWPELRKALFDRTLALLLLLLVLPVLLLVALLIRLDSPGPVFFRQLRVGYDNRMFRILKFRTMHHHLADSTASRQTVRGDDRITRVGRVLRSVSLDELPQLLNVLRGDMSLVGPRPHAPGTSVNGCRLDEVAEGYAARHRVKPGITGLAQVNEARGLHTEEQVVRRLRLDLEYIERCSLRLDLKILVLTALRELRSRNAF